MKIHEYQAKELLRKAGVAVLQNVVATTPEEAAAAFKQLGGPLAVVKAQIRELKVKRDEALAAKDPVELKRIRRKIHRLKRKLHKATV